MRKIKLKIKKKKKKNATNLKLSVNDFQQFQTKR